jgi:hypothetical protein
MPTIAMPEVSPTNEKGDRIRQVKVSSLTLPLAGSAPVVIADRSELKSTFRKAALPPRYNRCPPLLGSLLQTRSLPGLRAHE